MTAGEIVTVVALVGVPVASALIAIGVYLGKRNEAPAPPPRETSLAPATTPRGTLAEADLEAIRGRLSAVEVRQTATDARQTATEERVEANETKAQNFRERALVRLARIMEKLKITEASDGDRGSM